MAWIGIRPLAMSWPPARRMAEANGRGPQVLVDEDAGDAAGIHGGGEVVDVLLGERLDELGLEPRELARARRDRRAPGP